MKIFKNYTYTWQQIGVFKLALLSIGVIGGVQFSEFFTKNLTLVIVVALTSSAYLMYVSSKQW